MKLYEAIFDTLDRFGLEQIKTERLINFLADYRAFEVKPAKAILREFLKAGYGNKVYQLNIDDAPDKLIKLRSFGMDLIQSYGFNDVHVNYVLDSICYALFWIETPPEDPEGATSGHFSNSVNSVSGHARNPQNSAHIKQYWHKPNPEFNPDTSSINDEDIEQCWDLPLFVRMHGCGMSVAEYRNTITQNLFHACKCKDNTIVFFSNTLGELTAPQVAQEKDVLRVARLKNGRHMLFRGETAFISLFTAKWCRYSLDLIRSLQKKGIKYAEIDVDDQNEISSRYHIPYLPTICIINANDEIIKKWVGYDDDDHQVIELEEFLKKTKYKVIPHPEGRDAEVLAFETACHQVELLKAKYGQEIGVEDFELLIFCCASQTDFSLTKESYLWESQFSRIFDKIFNHIYQMKTPGQWWIIANSQTFKVNGITIDIKLNDIDGIRDYMKDYISRRLKFYSCLFPYLVSDRLPNYKQTIRNLYEAMHAEFCIYESITFVFMDNPYGFSKYNKEQESGERYNGNPTNSFNAAIKDVVFEAKII